MRQQKREIQPEQEYDISITQEEMDKIVTLVFERINKELGEELGSTHDNRKHRTKRR